MSGEEATVDALEGLMTPDPAEVAARRAMCRNSRWVLLLADHTKVAEVPLARLVEIEDIDLLVADDDLCDAAAREFEAAGLEVVRA
jgi:DeoR family fructose operon transcriptional repressor